MKSIAVILCAVALMSLAAQAGPERNIGKRHPNLKAAQNLVAKAFDKVSAAQQANKHDMGGHAAKAKDLLQQASDELKQAADAANDKK